MVSPELKYGVPGAKTCGQISGREQPDEMPIERFIHLITQPRASIRGRALSKCLPRHSFPYRLLWVPPRPVFSGHGLDDGSSLLRRRGERTGLAVGSNEQIVATPGDSKQAPLRGQPPVSFQLVVWSEGQSANPHPWPVG